MAIFYFSFKLFGVKDVHAGRSVYLYIALTSIGIGKRCKYIGKWNIRTANKLCSVLKINCAIEALN